MATSSGRKRLLWIVLPLLILVLFLLSQPLFKAPPVRKEKPAPQEQKKSDTLSILLPSTTAPASINELDRILQAAPWGNIAFNHPETMTLQETRVIELLLDMHLPMDSLKQRIQAEGKKLGARIRVFPRMRAELISKDFDIAALTPAEQLISHMEPTIWKWQIRPLKKGVALLHLTLSAPIEIQGSTSMRVIRVFDRSIRIRVTLGQRIGKFVGENWQWLWASILLPLGGWIWRRRQKKKRET